MKELLDIGFEKAGSWALVDNVLKPNIDKYLSENNILYAFIVDGEVKYVGKTTQTLLKRMGGYIYPGPTQTTNIKNKANILNALNDGYSVDIFVLADNGLMHYGIFHLNLSAGLEDSIIRELSPAWNGNYRKNNDLEGSVGDVELDTLKDGDNSFFLKLQKTYYDSGFINIPKDYSNYFGGDGDSIEIFLDNDNYIVSGIINRTAQGNETPRIMGYKLLKCWFQANKKPMDTLIIDPLTPNAIRIK